MARYVALLRGVNLGAKNKVPMTDLRDLFESLGHTDVSTFIQSGNVIFTAGASVAPKTVETAIASTFGIDIAVMVRTPQQLKEIVKANPFTGADPSKVHVGFMAQKPSAAVVRGLDAERFRPDEFAIRGSQLYLHLPDGMGRTKLPGYLDRQLKIPTTVRTWRTVIKLLELVGG